MSVRCDVNLMWAQHGNGNLNSEDVALLIHSCMMYGMASGICHRKPIRMPGRARSVGRSAVLYEHVRNKILTANDLSDTDTRLPTAH